jgi:hypothetical protein
MIAAAGLLACLLSAGTAQAASAHVNLVFGHPDRLTVSVYRQASPSTLKLARVAQGTTTDVQTVTQVEHLLNLAAPPGGRHSCPALPGTVRVFRFGYANGDTWTVHEDGCLGFTSHGLRGTGVGDPPVYTNLNPLADRIAGFSSSG